MYFNQTNQWNGIPMPLLMGFSKPEKIQEVKNEPIMYDPISQIVYDMRVVGTKCLKRSSTKKGSGTVQDQKNEIDDQKIVN